MDGTDVALPPLDALLKGNPRLGMAIGLAQDPDQQERDGAVKLRPSAQIQ